MEPYENDYDQTDDPVLWQLHEIRNKISLRMSSPDQINLAAKDIIKKYNLINLRIISHTISQKPTI